jgi:penicillin amidase
MTRKRIFLCSVLALSTAFQAPRLWVAQTAKMPASAKTLATLDIDGLKAKTRIMRDSYGIPHILAKNDHDVYFAMGYTHARDRFFQMDYVRRRASGTLAELLGGGGGDARLLGDIRNRSLGIRTSAERSLAGSSPEHMAILQAYAAGVNAWLQKNELPTEYGVLELTKTSVPEWTVIDSETIAKSFSFQFSFSNSDAFNTNVLAACETAGKAKGFDGQKLFYDDLFGAEPFFPPTIVPRSQNKMVPSKNAARTPSETVGKETEAAVREFLDQGEDVSLLSKRDEAIGSNWWVVAGSKTDTGLPMMANDPHLEIELPSVLYEIHLNVEKGPGQPAMNVYGVSYAGVPAVIIGFNEKIAWGATTSNLDVTDVYQEEVIVDPQSKTPLSTTYEGKHEPLVRVPEKFRVNQTGNGIKDDVVEIKAGVRPTGTLIPQATYLVPRRNNGPLITTPTGSDPEKKTALSIQFQGFSPSLELETFFVWARAENIKDFQRGLAYFDVGCLNWCYMDTAGNIGYFASGKVPLREDLQSGRFDGRPPFLIRDGTGTHKNEWVHEPSRAASGGFVCATLPPNEMPMSVNPTEGFLVSANNDPVGVAIAADPLAHTRLGGKGIYYIGRKFDAAFRAERITQLIGEKLGSSVKEKKITIDDVARIQSDVIMTDARWFLPYILRAFDSARAASAPEQLAALARNKAIAEAVGRLSKWDCSTPTGLPEGFDASDQAGKLMEPTEEEISNSVAATIYSVWRGQIIRNTIDATLTRAGLKRTEQSGFPSISPQYALTALKKMFELFATNKGIGQSGLNFFEADGFNGSAEYRRDFLTLKSLNDALDFLAGDNFAPAFKRSTNQADYRWGKLHRVTFPHPLGAMGLAPQFNVPPSAGLKDLSPDLPGVPVDGGYEVVDYSSHGPRAGSSKSFVFLSGPAMRFVIQANAHGFRAFQAFPGGPSGVPGSPYYDNMIRSWLSNDLNKVFFTLDELIPAVASIEELRPAL